MPRLVCGTLVTIPIAPHIEFPVILTKSPTLIISLPDYPCIISHPGVKVKDEVVKRMSSVANQRKALLWDLLIRFSVD